MFCTFLNKVSPFESSNVPRDDCFVALVKLWLAVGSFSARPRHDEKDVNSLAKGGVGVKLSARKTHVDFRRGLRSC